MAEFSLPEGQILIVSGPPGSGKSSLAERLAGSIPRGVHIESDWFFRSIHSGLIAPHLAASASQNDAVMDIAADTAVGYAGAGFGVVWDGIVGPWYLDRILNRLADRRVAVHYAVIRPPREVCLERVRRRDDTIDTSGAEVMFDQFAELGEFEHHVVSGPGDLNTRLSSGALSLQGAT